ncbi:hypothetical protein KEM60_03328 [Austwickia sp. TVS 96-490-7B]|uniref:DUF4234 domain-containing protein n=1 Tax=Austwickia sp. TVS 96-490-7B TaxID=2830843 RepID=UPI001C58F712|nr:DUF4234 domain-containing protein [Austwickia sp. TVS 96-490-7B]MBW3087098.1 hypothetical protein [Austwickia sp. TVS 96-490-7B]
MSQQFSPVPPSPDYPPVLYGATGQIGKVRSTGVVILLTIVTLGIYPLAYYYMVHQEMKDHTGEGIGGGIALLIGIFLVPVIWFVMPAEVGRLYERRGQQPPVTGLTGLWVLLPIIGGFVWLFKVNGWLNDYWRSLGA